MKTEYEVRVLEIDKDKMIETLENLGAQKIGDWHQKRYVYDIIPKDDNSWIRLRTNGIKTTLTFKCVKEKTIDGTKEAEVEVSDFDETNIILEQMGHHNRGFQENKRIQYVLDGVEVDIANNNIKFKMIDLDTAIGNMPVAVHGENFDLSKLKKDLNSSSRTFIIF